MRRYVTPCLLLLLLFTVSTMITGCSTSSVTNAVKKIFGKKPVSVQKPKPAPAPAPAPVDNPNVTDKACVVTVYGSDTCPYCRKVKAYLKGLGVAFVDKNVNSDPSANKEMRAKAKKRGLKVAGIPVIDICGDMVMGFNKEKINALLKKHGLLGGDNPPGPATATANVKPSAANACTVTVYGTSSCPWCKKAKAYLKSKCVPFADKDVGRDKGANQEMFSKVRAKGLTPRGVPVIDVCGDIVLGFNQGKIDQLLKKHGFSGCCSGGSCGQVENPGS